MENQPHAKAFAKTSRMPSRRISEGLSPLVIGPKSVSAAKWPQPYSVRASGRSYCPSEPLGTALRASCMSIGAQI